jgi:cytochrome oxidase Cu insertion factor (SCO1/SenC/PrrC family)
MLSSGYSSRVLTHIVIGMISGALVSVLNASPIEVVAPATGTAESSRVLTPRGGQAWSNYFPNVELTTHNGDLVRFYDDLIKGKVVLINFMYATCTNS